MKVLFELAGGAVQVTEDAGNFALVVNKDLLVGGGSAAGILELEGAGKVVLKGKAAFDLGMKLLEAHSPAALVPLEQGVQAIADAAIDKL